MKWHSLKCLKKLARLSIMMLKFIDKNTKHKSKTMKLKFIDKRNQITAKCFSQNLQAVLHDLNLHSTTNLGNIRPGPKSKARSRSINLIIIIIYERIV